MTEQNQQYIYENHKVLTIKDMSKKLNISYHKVRSFMILKEWQSDHWRTTTVYKTELPIADMFSWEFFKKSDFIFQSC